MEWRRQRCPRKTGTSLHPQAIATISSRMPSPPIAWAVSPSAGSHAGECPLPLSHRMGSWLLGCIEYRYLVELLSGRAPPPSPSAFSISSVTSYQLSAGYSRWPSVKSQVKWKKGRTGDVRV